MHEESRGIADGETHFVEVEFRRLVVAGEVNGHVSVFVFLEDRRSGDRVGTHFLFTHDLEEIFDVSVFSDRVVAA